MKHLFLILLAVFSFSYPCKADEYQEKREHSLKMLSSTDPESPDAIELVKYLAAADFDRPDVVVFIDSMSWAAQDRVWQIILEGVSPYTKSDSNQFYTEFLVGHAAQNRFRQQQIRDWIEKCEENNSKIFYQTRRFAQAFHRKAGTLGLWYQDGYSARPPEMPFANLLKSELNTQRYNEQGSRAHRCWTGFRNFIANHSLPFPIR